MTIIRIERGRTRADVAPGAGGRIAQVEVFDGARWVPLLHDDATVPLEQRDPLAKVKKQ